MGRAIPADLETISIFESVAREVRRRNRIVRVEFYPYSCIKSVARERDGYVDIRISDLLMDSPPEVRESLAYILLCRGRRGCPPERRRAYDRYVSSQEMQDRDLTIRRGRGKGPECEPKGKHYDLGLRFDIVNRRYFGGEMERPLLTWSKQVNRRTWGSHDEVHNIITLNRRLDADDVPAYVVDYVLYHEMLHLRHLAQVREGKRLVHTRDFRDEETAFPMYEETERWLKRRG